MHGDFLEESVDGKLVGGVCRLSGYIQEVRKKKKMFCMPLSAICLEDQSLILSIVEFQPLN